MLYLESNIKNRLKPFKLGEVYVAIGKLLCLRASYIELHAYTLRLPLIPYSTDMCTLTLGGLPQCTDKVGFTVTGRLSL